MASLDELLNSLAALPSDWHAAGCLEMPNLEALGRHAAARRITYSMETGAGKSTLLLSHLSERHLVFAVNDGNSLASPLESPLLRRETVEFIEGPSQRTLMGYGFTEPLQLAFIDGPHGFPFPNLEYWKIYPHLDTGALLVIDDIHIPTIRQLFDFLREDEMFTLIETVGKTAFFERTAAPTFSPWQDGWWLQAYNTKRFPVPYDEASLEGETVADQAPEDYRARLLPLIERWICQKARVAVFGIGPHTDYLFGLVPELEQLPPVAFLDSSAERQGTTFRGAPVKPPASAAEFADVVLCSSYEHEYVQMQILDTVSVKVVPSHKP